MRKCHCCLLTSAGDEGIRVILFLPVGRLGDQPNHAGHPASPGPPLGSELRHPGRRSRSEGGTARHKKKRPAPEGARRWPPGHSVIAYVSW